MTGWGRAGVRLTDAEVNIRRREAIARRNQAEKVRLESNRVAYRLWRAGELKPHLITLALDARKLYGPEVDEACGAKEPDVDLWEAGKLYPTWEQLLLLAELVGKTPKFLCSKFTPAPVEQTSLRFHRYGSAKESPRVLAFTPEAVAATVAGTPEQMPD